jgi:hypothetical protein
MSRSRWSIWLCLSLFFFGACTAWQYEIESCDPNARDLSKDVCHQLNGAALGCVIYQCDGQTSTCRELPRDFDRDGDPDLSCGGTDCNDYDPSVYGRLGDLCTCKPDVLNTTCSVGQPGSPCERKAKYACLNGSLGCPATPAAPQDWQSGPDPMNSSWDWSCDGKIDTACSWMDFTGRYFRTDCPPTPCSDGQRMLIAMDQSAMLCGTYCDGLDKPACDSMANKPAVLNCDVQPNCGSRIGVCHCRWDGLGPPLGSCIAETYSTIGSIYCK